MSPVRAAVIDFEPAERPPEPSSGPSEPWLKSIIDLAPVSLIVLEADGRVIAANRAALTMRGARAEEVVGRNVCHGIAPQDRQRFERFVVHVCGGTAGTLRHDLLPIVGSAYAVETRGVPLHRATGGPVFLGATEDVRDHDRLERALRHAEARVSELEGERALNGLCAPAYRATDSQDLHQAL